MTEHSGRSGGQFYVSVLHRKVTSKDRGSYGNFGEMGIVVYSPPIRACHKGGKMSVRFPITDLLDEQECYNWLMYALHPDGLQCPKLELRSAQLSCTTSRANPLDCRGSVMGSSPR